MIARLLACLTVTVALFAANARADVTITKDGDAYRVHAAAYEATIAADGNMTHLDVGGQNLLCDHVDVARGTYFFHNGAVKLGAVKQPDGHTIVAAGDVATATYDFADDRVTITAADTSGEAMPFYVVFEPVIRGISDGHGGKPAGGAATAGWGTPTLYSDVATVATAGCSRVWGPWFDRQVWDADLAAHETRTVTLAVAKPSPADLAFLASLPPVPWQPGQAVVEQDVTVVAPMEYQVVQRQTVGAGRVRVSGRVKPACDAVEVRVIGTAYDGAKVPDAWQPVRYTAATRSFDAELTEPAGGWYAVEVRATAAGKVVASTVVAHVGVGEVFVGAGQSNSTNSGQERTTPHSGLVSAFGGNGWQLADDPQPGTHDRSTGGSFWPAFGDAMVARYHVPVGVAVTGHGGTSVKQWAPGGELFTWTLGRVQQLGPGGFRAVLWHQGESDWGMSADEYADRLGQVILSTQKAAGWECPWFVAHASYHDPDHTHDDAVRRGQQMLWDRGVALEGPDTDALVGDSRDFGGKGIHLSPKGLSAHGQRWADKVAAYVDAAAGAGPGVGPR